VEAGGRALGTVREVIPGPANDVLEVDGGEGPVLVPFTADAVIKLDRAGRRLALRPDLLDG
jgi:ribosomal 30S subunit maturation factor RimM